MPQLTIDRQLASDTCAHCGKVYSVSRGSVYDAGMPFALYIAGLHGCQAERVVALGIAVAQPAGQTPLAVTIRVWSTDTSFQMRLVEPSASPWRSHPYLGRLLTREEALASLLKDTFYAIADIVMTENPEVNAFLSG